MKVLVTGGGGFIGSHLVDTLVKQGHEAAVIDSLVSGNKKYVNSEAVLIKKDIRIDEINPDFKDIETVFHFAADPDVRTSADNPKRTLDYNVIGTFNVLEACKANNVKRVVLASTSTVYGETRTIPTPESHPCNPISNYGASKLACEAYLSAYCGSYGIKGTSLRFANIFGERSTHGVMHDFFYKLKENPDELHILGNGNQDKSYLHVSDCISAILTAWKKQDKNYEAFNIGSREKITVNKIAHLVCEILDKSPKLVYTGTQRGWIGDVPLMLLDTSKLQSLGWYETINFKDAIVRYIDWLHDHPIS